MTSSAPATTENNAPATQAPQTIAGLITTMKSEIARALPRGMEADRVARLALTQVKKTPQLAQCTAQSFAGALLTSSALGLEPGVNGECYLVPYRDKRSGTVECQLIIGYQGIAKLYWQSPLASYIDTGWVGENDEFDYGKGLNPYLEHRPARGDRGKPIYYYAIVRVKGADMALWDVFTPEQIQALRRGKVGSSGDIPDPERWMERKTALKQVLKLAPKSTRLDRAMGSDEAGGGELYHTMRRDVEIEANGGQPVIEGEFTEGEG
jgi:recombination protein RecT